MIQRPATPFAESAAARLKALELLAGVELDGVDEILLREMLDPNGTVGARAREALLYRYPWLALGIVDTESIASGRWDDYRFGKPWRRLRGAVGAWARTLPRAPLARLGRFARLPGLVADLAEGLRAAGRAGDAARLLRHFRRAPRVRRPRYQILVAPTYACNLNCPYCYVKGWRGRMGGHMTRDAFQTLLAWCCNQGINWMIFGGGESTVHPAFPELVREAWQAGIQVSLTSNGLYNAAARAVVRPPAVPEFICHVEQNLLLNDPAGTARLRQNLAAAAEAGVELRMRYTLTPRSDRQERDQMLDFARAAGVRVVNYGFAFRNMDATNEWYRYGAQRGAAFDRTLNDFMDQAHARGLALHLSKPFPLCQVGPDTLRRTLREGGLRMACSASQRGFSMNLTVNPDLSTLPCNALGVRGPRLTEFKTLGEAGVHSAEILRELYRRPWRPECARCVLHYRGCCQGACLAEHLSSRPMPGRGNGEKA